MRTVSHRNLFDIFDTKRHARDVETFRHDLHRDDHRFRLEREKDEVVVLVDIRSEIRINPAFIALTGIFESLHAEHEAGSCGERTALEVTRLIELGLRCFPSVLQAKKNLFAPGVVSSGVRMLMVWTD